MLVCTFTTFFLFSIDDLGNLRYYVVFGELIGFFPILSFCRRDYFKMLKKLLLIFLQRYIFFITNPFRILFHKLYLLISVLLAKLWKRIKPRRKPKKES